MSVDLCFSYEKTKEIKKLLKEDPKKAIRELEKDPKAVLAFKNDPYELENLNLDDFKEASDQVKINLLVKHSAYFLDRRFYRAEDQKKYFDLLSSIDEVIPAVALRRSILSIFHIEDLDILSKALDFLEKQIRLRENKINLDIDKIHEKLRTALIDFHLDILDERYRMLLKEVPDALSERDFVETPDTEESIEENLVKFSKLLRKLSSFRPSRFFSTNKFDKEAFVATLKEAYKTFFDREIDSSLLEQTQKIIDRLENLKNLKIKDPEREKYTIEEFKDIKKAREVYLDADYEAIEITLSDLEQVYEGDKRDQESLDLLLYGLEVDFPLTSILETKNEKLRKDLLSKEVFSRDDFSESLSYIDKTDKEVAKKIVHKFAKYYPFISPYHLPEVLEKIISDKDLKKILARGIKKNPNFLEALSQTKSKEAVEFIIKNLDPDINLKFIPIARDSLITDIVTLADKYPLANKLAKFIYDELKSHVISIYQKLNEEEKKAFENTIPELKKETEKRLKQSRAKIKAALPNRFKKIEEALDKLGDDPTAKKIRAYLEKAKKVLEQDLKKKSKKK